MNRIGKRLSIRKEILILMGLISLLAGCVHGTPFDGPGTGGSNTSYDKKAPKEIQSAEITDFSCSFFTTTMSDLGDDLVYGEYILEAKADSVTGEVKGSYTSIQQNVNLVSPTFTFVTDNDFMAKLEQIVRESKIVSINGTHHKTYGIPPEFGSDLDVKYASGEYISCSDNQGSQLGDDTMHALKKLFYEESGAVAFYDTQEPLSLYYNTGIKGEYSLYAYVFKNPDGSYTCRISEKQNGEMKKYGEKTIDSSLMDKFGEIYAKNKMDKIRDHSDREGEWFVMMEVQFGTKYKDIRSNMKMTDAQYDALVGLKELMLEQIERQ